MNPSARARIIDEILKAVRRGRTFFLTGHVNPDGDTVGCELAFASLLGRLGKRVDIVNRQSVPPPLRFLPGIRRVKTARKMNKAYDVAVVFECFGPERMGRIIDLKKQARTVINIDHHAHHADFGHINLIDPKASSNSELLIHIFERAGMPLLKAEAAALYTGLVTDTGRFQQENANPASHRAAAVLLEAGAPVAELSRRLYATFPLSTLRLLGRALSSLRLLRGGRVARMALARRDFKACGAGPGETEDMINYGLMVPSVEVAALFREDEPGRVKVSLRGKGRVDLCRLAVSFGGGGHHNASGFTVRGSLARAERSVLKRLSLP